MPRGFVSALGELRDFSLSGDRRRLIRFRPYEYSGVIETRKLLSGQLRQVTYRGGGLRFADWLLGYNPMVSRTGAAEVKVTEKP
jgi:hypothetical protein